MKNNKKIMERLMGLSGAVIGQRDPHAYVIRSPSPSLNFIFGNAHGLPAGYSLLLYGPPKAGKSLVSNLMTGQLHKDDPEAYVIKFNTEYREAGQLTDDQAKKFGIDPDRYMAYETNKPDEIYDRIENEFPALQKDLGAKIKLVIIDSLTGIQGRRALEDNTVMTQQRGDNALTNQEGLKRILPVQRQLGFGLIVTAHIRAEQNALEQKRGNVVRPAISFATGHHCEYNMYVEHDRRADARKDIFGKNAEFFIDKSVKDLDGNGALTGHRILVQMVDSSMGPKERVGKFTLDYNRGITNTHEEVFLLGTGYGIIARPNNQTYEFGDKSWRGKEAMLSALEQDPVLCEAVLTELRSRDMSNTLKAAAQPVEESPAE